MLTLRLPAPGGLIRLSYLDIIIFIQLSNWHTLNTLLVAPSSPSSLLLLSPSHYNQFRCSGLLMQQSDNAIGNKRVLGLLQRILWFICLCTHLQMDSRIGFHKSNASIQAVMGKFACGNQHWHICQFSEQQVFLVSRDGYPLARYLILLQWKWIS